MDNKRTIKELTDELYSSLKPVSLTENITTELLERTSKFKDNFIMALSKQYFNDEMLDISDREFDDLSEVFYNITQLTSSEFCYRTNEYLDSLPEGTIKELTEIGTSILQTGIKRNAIKESKSQPEDYTGFNDSVLYL